MKSEDPLRPYHAQDRAYGQEAADAVAAVLKHAAEREEAARLRPPPRRRPQWMLPLGVNLAILAVYLLMAHPRWVVVNPIEGPDLASRQQSLLVAMHFQAQRIESYRIEHGSVPVNLSDAGSAVADIDYIRRGDHEYQLVATVGERPVVYDSTQPDPSFAEAAAARLLGG